MACARADGAKDKVSRKTLLKLLIFRARLLFNLQVYALMQLAFIFICFSRIQLINSKPLKRLWSFRGRYRIMHLAQRCRYCLFQKVLI